MKLSDTGTLSPDDVVARIGKLTASRMKDAMSFLKNGQESAARKAYKRDLVAERLTNVIVPHYVTGPMLHGIEHEAAAKSAYTLATGRAIRPAPFLDHPTIDLCGATPDGFVEHDGLIEVKCPTAGKYLEWLMDGVVPDEHKPQMLLQLSVTRKAWVDFVAYHPSMPANRQLFIRRFAPMDLEIEAVETAARNFLLEVDEMFEAITQGS